MNLAVSLSAVSANLLMTTGIVLGIVLLAVVALVLLTLIFVVQGTDTYVCMHTYVCQHKILMWAHQLKCYSYIL